MKSFKYLALATLVAFAGCSESSTGGGGGTGVDITGTISGTVTIGGSGASGITVSLSSGSTATTDGSGAYSFAAVPAGAYTITISDYPADVSFTSTSKAATISTAGATVTVGFAGSYITTSSISGSISASGAGVAGVAVTASGPGGDKSGVSDANGNYSFNGLRAGTYTLTISNIPSGYTFPTTTATVTVGVGEAKQAPFVGTKEAADVSATVVIQSVTTSGTGTTLPVNPNNVAGQIEVTLAIEPGTNTITQVCVLLDDQPVPNGCQTLSSSGAPGVDGPRAASGLQPVFSINSASTTDGAADYTNKVHTLSAVLDLSGAKKSTVQTDMSLTFNNPNVFNVAVVPSNAPAFGGDGLQWMSGSLTLTGTAIMYTDGVHVASANLCAQQNSATGAPAMGTKVCRPVNSSPFEVTLPKTSSTGTNLSLFSSMDVRITASTVTDAGTTGPGLTTVTGPSIRLDEVAPTFTTALPTSVTNNYLGKDFVFKSTSGAGPSMSRTVTDLLDPGSASGDAADGTVVTYHATTTTLAGSNTSTNNKAVVAANPGVTDVTGLASTVTNDAYVLVVQAVDAVGNTTVTRLGAMFGVDLVAPTFTIATGSTKDQSINPGGTLVLSIADDYSGFATNPVEATIMKKTTNAVTGATVTECVADDNNTIGDVADVASALPSNGDPCVASLLPSSTFSWSTTNAGYYNLVWDLVDQAGNVSETGSRDVLLDLVPPTVTVGGFSVASNNVTVSGTIKDNLDNGWWDARLQFTGLPAGNLPFSAVTTVSGFGEPLVASSSPSGSAPLIRGVEDGLGGTDYNLTGAGFGTADVAGNFAEDYFAAAQVFGGLPGTVTAFTLNNPDICYSGKTTSTYCGATNPVTSETVTLKAVATTGPTDINPFPNGVWFYVEGGTGTQFLLGHATSAALQTLTGPDRREWTWTMTLTSSQIPSDVTVPGSGTPGTLNVHAVAVDKEYDALHQGATLVTR